MMENQVLSSKNVYAGSIYECPAVLDAKLGNKTRSVLCAAITDSRKRTFAVLSAHNKTSGSFTKEDEATVQRLTSHVGQLMGESGDLLTTVIADLERLVARPARANSPLPTDPMHLEALVALYGNGTVINRSEVGMLLADLGSEAPNPLVIRRLGASDKEEFDVAGFSKWVLGQQPQVSLASPADILVSLFAPGSVWCGEVVISNRTEKLEITILGEPTYTGDNVARLTASRREESGQSVPAERCQISQSASDGAFSLRWEWMDSSFILLSSHPNTTIQLAQRIIRGDARSRSGTLSGRFELSCTQSGGTDGP